MKYNKELEFIEVIIKESPFFTLSNYSLYTMVLKTRDMKNASSFPSYFISDISVTLDTLLHELARRN